MNNTNSRLITDEKPSFHFKLIKSSRSINSKNEYTTLGETLQNCDIRENVPEDTSKDENISEAKANNECKYENSQENRKRYKRIVSLMFHLDAPDIGTNCTLFNLFSSHIFFNHLVKTKC